MRVSRDVWVLIALLAALMVGGQFLGSKSQRKESKAPTTYNADPQGVKAFYTLLHRLGYRLDRLLQPYDKMPDGAKVLIVVQPRAMSSKSGPIGARITDGERDALKRWVLNGGTAIFIADDLKGVPTAFGSTRRMGHGCVYAFSSKRLITNRGMRDYRNAVRLVRIVGESVPSSPSPRPSPAGGEGDLILLDEYHHGIGESRGLMSYLGPRGRIAVWMLLAAGLILAYSRARRFGAVRSLPSSETLRPGYEFVESVGRLYQRAHAADLAAEILCDSFKHELCARLGLPSDAEPEAVTRRAAEDAGAAVGEQVRDLLSRCSRARGGERLSEAELVVVAREVKELEETLGIRAEGPNS